MRNSADPAARFSIVYDSTYDDLLRYVQRRLSCGDAEDVVAEAMTVAWRRVDEMPARMGMARAWIFGIGRRCVLAHRRSHGRHDDLGVLLAQAQRGSALGEADPDLEVVARRVDLARAWTKLRPAEQDVLALTLLEDLTSAQAGHVLGISAVAYRVRLNRARTRLRRTLGESTQQSGPTLCEETQP